MDAFPLVRTCLRMVESGMAHPPFDRDVVRLFFILERQVVRALRQHFNYIDPPEESSALLPALTDQDDSESPARILNSLLDRSMSSSVDDSRNALHLALLRLLLADEARILAAVSDGTVFPVIHVAEPGGGKAATVLENASTVGRAAGVSFPQHTPLYITRMQLSGLVAVGPKGSSEMDDEYELLLADPAVNHALAEARRGVRPARVIRRTLSISELGQELWKATQ